MSGDSDDTTHPPSERWPSGVIEWSILKSRPSVGSTTDIGDRESTVCSDIGRTSGAIDTDRVNNDDGDSGIGGDSGVYLSSCIAVRHVPCGIHCSAREK